MTHIVKLTARDFKRLVAVEIEPTGRVVPITGMNGHGKTSVLDAITAALVGQKDFKLDKPVREGAPDAEVEVDLGDFVVTRKWRGDRSSLEVKLANGTAVPGARKVLDDLIGKLSFDPLLFAEADAKAQRAMLLEAVGLVEQDAAISTERQRHYDARTVHNRDAKRLQAQLDGLPRPDPTHPVGRVDVAALSAQLSEAMAHASEFEQMRTRVASVDREIAELQRRLDQLVAERTAMTVRGRELAAMNLNAVVADLRGKLDSAQAVNESAQRYERREETNGELQASLRAAESASGAIVALDTKRKALLAGVDLPIQGLSVDDEGVLLNGVPFSQASAAERLRTSVAMAMKMNPKLRVIRIADASLLDSVNRALIETMAEENDFQIWLEVVDESRGVGFVIEDGQVVHREQ